MLGRRSRGSRFGAYTRPLLLAGGVSLLLALAGGGCGAVAEPACEGDRDGGRPLACCNQCEPFVDCGKPRPFHAYPSQSQTVAEWRAFCEYDGSVAHGECENGLRFVQWSNGLVTEWRYFDATGAFVALEGFSDLIDEVCGGRWYWPKPVDCSRRKWGATICTRPPQL